LFKENNKFMNVLEIKERLIYIKSLIDESNLDEELLSSLSNELEELEEELKSLF
tara:strand:- start:1665 stop:1826 length:162 start_codon:yes stop_codon:yes gene_type:complete